MTGGVRARDLVQEVALTIAARPGRMLAATVSVFLAAAAYVATSGLSATLAQQVSDRFDAARATEVDAYYQHLASDEPARSCPIEAADAVRRLVGVTAAGEFDVVKSATVTAGADPELATDGILVGATGGAITVIGPRLTAGRVFDDGHVRRSDPVAVLPVQLATALGVTAAGQSINVAGQRLIVVGLFDDVLRRPDMLRAVIVPSSTLAGLQTGRADDAGHTCGLLAATRAGAAAQVAGQLPLALRPDAPETLTVVAPPDPTTFRRTVERPVRLLALALSLAALAIGAASIASTMSASTAARVAEIGLRKALGARAIDIAAQITGESLVVGLVGGASGALAGSYTVIGVALAHGWQPILSLGSVAEVCAVGAALGGLAGLAPAVRAARLPASEALRR